MSPIWPTAAAAWSWCSACGRFFQLRRFMPAAIAPLDTSTTSRPRARISAICAAQRDRASSSSPSPAAASRLEPILTTKRRDRSTTVPMKVLPPGAPGTRRESFGQMRSCLPLPQRFAGFPPALSPDLPCVPRGLRSCAVPVEVIGDGEDELLTALAGQRRDDEAPALPSEAGEKLLHGAGARGGFEEIGLVEHDPARLAVEAFVEFPQLLDDRPRFAHGVRLRVEWRQVHEVQQEP